MHWKNLVTGKKQGEPKAICLGLVMVVCSAIMYFFIGITIVPLYNRSVWTKESVCKLMTVKLKEKVYCLFNEGSGHENIFRYPCLEVKVNLTLFGEAAVLYHTDETMYKNPKCFYVPPNMENYDEVQKDVEEIMDILRKQPIFDCYYDPLREETSVISKRLYPTKGLVLAFIWPTLMLIGGVLIVVLVKINQFLSAYQTESKKRKIKPSRI